MEKRGETSASFIKRITEKRGEASWATSYMSQQCLCNLQKQELSPSSDWKKQTRLHRGKAHASQLKNMALALINNKETVHPN
jgi:hypothetical protein